MATLEHKRALVAAAAAALVVVASGCGTDEPDLVNGKRRFMGEGRCGKCHTLARAGTKSTVGPSLDSAFRRSLKDGMNAKTFEGIVYDQIDTPRNSSVMPADLVKGQDARDVAAYVAQAAGRSGGDEGGPREVGGSDPHAERGRTLFLRKGCGGCHILSDAKTGASEGPTLNNLQRTTRVERDRARQYIEKSILDPDDVIVGGFRAGLMPSYRGKLTREELDTLVDYLLRVTK